MSIERVIILHGYMASPSSHWFEWLHDELTPEGVEVAIPALPNSTAPEPEAWITAAARVLGEPNDRTAVVGHSLGCVTALHALDRLDGTWNLSTLIAVSGFVSPAPALPELDPFTNTVPHIARVAGNIRRRAVVRSDNDTFVTPSLTTELGQLLRAEEIVVPGAGHFRAAEGITSLPEVAALLRS
ncbi:alpha/beta fold hydrolase [Nonomuraea phyllanthi]|uniref:Alpha/beta fold hydrolase n=1 Tax=Nonomuraea phyllanthi TaxID=2219224 RepID=A0A5C4VHP6_9ACTN|nr:alpha/beta fold hydrolase [Nonomuraea phyllanthi]KAB8189047.1 alpha/beta fold hydrolase [Nonomuraea phyllanthi]